MEPMTLGSPGGSPAYLPSFLLGDTSAASPDKSRNVVNLAMSPQDFNRSNLEQKNQSMQLNVSSAAPPTAGPPTTGLFDSLRNDMNQVTTPKRDNCLQSPNQLGTPIRGRAQQQYQHHQQQSAFGINANENSFNASRSILSPLGGHNTSQQYGNSLNFGNNNFWITVFGFPPSSSTAILQHFTSCGTIVDKIFAPQNGNWMHIKFSAQSECARALNYSEKILFENIMIGVTQNHERNILEKENLADTGTPQACRPRPLIQSTYKPAQSDASVVNSPVTNLRPTGIVNKAMDFLFNW